MIGSVLGALAGPLGRGGRPLRIAYGRIFHEACAYSPLTTTREAFTGFHRLEGDALARAASLTGSELEGYLPAAELTGFNAAARVAGDVETVPLASSLAVPSGPVDRDVFDWLVDDLIERLAHAGRLDGVYLALHGSMQVVGLDEAPEAVILRRVREVVGDEAKLAASFDLHGNLSAGIVDALDVLVAYRTNPHWDLAPTGYRAGNRLIRALRGHVRPVHAWRKLPLVLGGGVTIDFLKPMNEVFRFMRRLERDPKVLSASLFMVHPFTAADDLGWAVHVTTDDDAALAERLADDIADEAWARRRVPMPRLLPADEAIAEAASHPLRRLGPVTLVDCDDIVGAGAPGGNTRLLQALMERAPDLTAYVPVHDPRAIEQLWGRAEGESLEVSIRGTEGYGMPEVRVRGVLAKKATTDFGRTVRLDAGRLQVALTERAPLPVHPKFWRELGARARDADVIVQKNFFHYRMFYAATSFAHVPVTTGGATSFDHVRGRDYRVPTYPVDDPSDWRPWDPTLRQQGWGGAQSGLSRPGTGPAASSQLP